MNIYTINETTFNNEHLQSKGIPMMLMGQIFEKISSKFKTLDTIEGKSIILIEKPLAITSDSSKNIAIFKLSGDQQLFILDYNSVLSISQNNNNRYFVSNELEMVSSDTNNPQEKFTTLNVTDPQTKKALDWLTTNGVGNSAQSIVFHLFDNLKNYYEQVKHEEFSFSHPRDTSDFSRCMKIINLLDLSQSQVESLRSISSEWNNLIDNYSDLTNLMNQKNYDEAYQLIKTCIASSPKRKP